MGRKKQWIGAKERSLTECLVIGVVYKPKELTDQRIYLSSRSVASCLFFLAV